MLPSCVHDYKLSQCAAAQRPAGGGPGGAPGQQEARERAQDHRQEDARTGQIFFSAPANIFTRFIYNICTETEQQDHAGVAGAAHAGGGSAAADGPARAERAAEAARGQAHDRLPHPPRRARHRRRGRRHRCLGPVQVGGARGFIDLTFK